MFQVHSIHHPPDFIAIILILVQIDHARRQHGLPGGTHLGKGLRGFGDILGFKQSGIKNFKLADPIHNHNLFILAEKEIKRIENEKEDIGRFKPLIKLYDRADIINDIA